MSNITKELLVQKADQTVASFQANGGLLNAEQGDRFLKTLLKGVTMLNRVRVVQMTKPEVEIAKIGFGKRIMRAAVESEGLSLAERSTLTTSKLVLTSKEAIAEIRVPYQLMEDAIEQAAIQFGADAPAGVFINTILDLVAERAQVDIEDAMLNGDTARTKLAEETNGEHAFMAQHDGWLKLAMSGNVVDFSNAKISRTLLKKAMQVLPGQYLRDRSNMMFLVSNNQEIEYQDTLAGRETALGDSKHNENNPARAAGALVVPVPMMPDNKGIFANPKNFIFGIRRDVSMEFEKLISERQYKIVLTVRMCPRVEWADAVVGLDNIGAV